MSSGVEDTTKASRRPKGTGTVRQRGKGKWQLQVFVGTDTETGRPCQVSRFVTARNKTEAQRKLRQWPEELADSEPMGAGNAAVRSLIEEWLRHSAARGRAPRTLHDARRSAETVIYPEFGDKRIVDLTPRDLDEWYRKHATGEGRSRALKATSIRRHHAVLSASLSPAVRWGWLDCNPAERAHPPVSSAPSSGCPPTTRCAACWPPPPSAMSAGGCS